jgi:hypothetical protein
MSLKITGSASPITDAELTEMEQRLGMTIPGEYRLWLLQHNGGRPEPHVVQFRKTDGPYTDVGIRSFFSDAEVEGCAVNYKLIRQRLPNRLFPMGNDSFGNLICISTSGKDKGFVYFWDHEEEEEAANSNCYLLARKFSEFLDNLSSAQ